MSFFNKFGNYPPEYNREVHGPYNPAMYYGKRDTPFGDVKLGELMPWLARRNKSPRAMAQAISRAWFSYLLKWAHVKYPGPAYLYQIMAGSITLFYFCNYGSLQREKWYRYH